MRLNRNVLTVAAVGLALGAAGCGGSGGDDAPDETVAGGAEVAINTFSFEPSPLTVEAGTTVTFSNEDNILHTVTAGERENPTGEFDEKLDGAGSSAEIDFDEPGTYPYFCSIHNGQDGELIVE